MSELKTSKVRAEITVLCIKNRKVSILTGRYGTYVEAYALAVQNGYKLLTYTTL